MKTLMDRIRDAGFSEEACISALQEEYTTRSTKSKNVVLRNAYSIVSRSLQHIQWVVDELNHVESMSNITNPSPSPNSKPNTESSK